jgi:NAD kinase
VISNITNLLLTIDGQEAIRFSGGDEILFRLSDKKMKIILHPKKITMQSSEKSSIGVIEVALRF